MLRVEDSFFRQTVESKDIMDGFKKRSDFKEEAKRHKQKNFKGVFLSK